MFSGRSNKKPLVAGPSKEWAWSMGRENLFLLPCCNVGTLPTLTTAWRYVTFFLTEVKFM